MYYKVKVTRDIEDTKGKQRRCVETYLTDATNFAEAGYNVLQIVTTSAEVESITLMKAFKPSINEKRNENDKLYIVKIAEDRTQDDGTIKTLKYEIPAFAKDSDELQQLVRDYIAQGLDDMRLTTISETKWIFI